MIVKNALPLCLTIIMLFSATDFAELQWGGSYENTLDGIYLSDRSNILDENRLRVDLKASFGSAVSFSGDVVFRKFFGTTRYDATAFLPERIANPIPSSVLTLLGETETSDLFFAYRDTFYVDNAAVTIEKERTIFTAGIQQLPWGSGYAWNPTDLWNRKDILDPSYEKPGQAALKFDQGIGPLSITAVAGFSKDYLKSPWTVTLTWILLGFDLTALGAYCSITFENELYDGAQTWERDRYCAGYSLSGEIAGIGIHSEGGWNRERADDSFEKTYPTAMNDFKPLENLGVATDLFESDHASQKDYAQIVAGIDYTFGIGNGVFIMSEYFYNGDGKKKSRDYTIEDWMEYLSGDNLSLGKHTLFSGISYPVTDLSTLSLYAIANISDGSVALNPWFTVSITDDCELDITGAIPIGGDNDEFGRKQYMGRARVTVYW